MVQKIRPERERLDRVLVNRGLVASREDAARLILAGLVRVDGVVVDKAAKLTLPDAAVEVTGPASPYVGRGGEKLAGALDELLAQRRARLAEEHARLGSLLGADRTQIEAQAPPDLLGAVVLLPAVPGH